MIDPELKTSLTEINQSLVELKNKKSGGVWRAFFNGMFSALGYMVGLALVIVILGWILQKTGLLKSFQDQIKSFNDLINSAKKLVPPDSSNNSQSSNTRGGSSGESIITLPDGRQVRVQLPNQ